MYLSERMLFPDGSTVLWIPTIPTLDACVHFYLERLAIFVVYAKIDETSMNRQTQATLTNISNSHI